MLRSDVIQNLLLSMNEPSYLEIGVQRGLTFHAIKAKKKVAVDPVFDFDLSQARESNKNCEYFQMKSDNYFEFMMKFRVEFDLIFIDGLHTFEQTLRDLLNATYILKRYGIIIVDDVMPVTYLSSISDIVQFSQLRQILEVADGSWMGDVYKVIFFLRHYMPGFSYATVSENHGQTVIWRSPRSLDADTMKIEAISRLDYGNYVRNMRQLNIKPFMEIQADIKADFTAEHNR